MHIREWKREHFAALLALSGISVLSLGSVATAQGFGDPLPGLTAEQRELFEAGQEDFEEIETMESGLGPTFNGSGCALCHASPAVGGSSPLNEVRAGLVNGDGFDPLESQGGSLFQRFAVRDECAEVIPAEANVIAERQTPPLFGMGLIEAIPESLILEQADPDDRNGDGISGRKGRGRFGWKAQVVSLFEFSGDAYLNEMGITNDLFPFENAPNGNAVMLDRCDAIEVDGRQLRIEDPEDQPDETGRRGIDNFTNFMRFLGPPPRGPITPDVSGGRGMFVAVGCAKCHTPVMATGPNAVAALRWKLVPLFSDLLLHDVGAGDGIAQAGAEPNEIRTPPLWGLRESGPFLHDGSATTVEQAILAHENEAEGVIDRFKRLRREQKDRLLAFLNSL